MRRPHFTVRVNLSIYLSIDFANTSHLGSSPLTSMQTRNLSVEPEFRRGFSKIPLPFFTFPGGKISIPRPLYLHLRPLGDHLLPFGAYWSSQRRLRNGRGSYPESFWAPAGGLPAYLPEIPLIPPRGSDRLFPFYRRATLTLTPVACQSSVHCGTWR